MCFLFLGFGVSGIGCASKFVFDGAIDRFTFVSLVAVFQGKFLFECLFVLASCFVQGVVHVFQLDYWFGF